MFAVNKKEIKIYIFPGLVCLFRCSQIGTEADQSWEYINRSQIHECSNWECADSFLGIHKSDFRYSVGPPKIRILLN